MTHETPPQPEPLPTFARTGILTHHDLGCRCWPHVSERDALDAIAAVGLAEYRDGVAARLPVSGEPLDASHPLLAGITDEVREAVIEGLTTDPQDGGKG